MYRRLSGIILLVGIASILTGCRQIGALTLAEAARGRLAQMALENQSFLVQGSFPAPGGDNLVVFSYITQGEEDEEPLTALGFILLERSHTGLWEEVDRGTYITEASSLTGELIQYAITVEPQRYAAVFGRILDSKVSAIQAVLDDGSEQPLQIKKNSFAVFAKEGAYPISLRVMNKDGVELKTYPLNLTESMAMETLTAFFAYLHDGLFEQASQLYGGSYQELAAMNSLIDPDDHAALWENACKINGFQCLYVSSISPGQSLGHGEFAFEVTFQDDQGNIFRRGECCGAETDNALGETTFIYRVKKSEDGQFKVLNPPPYLP